MREKQTLDEIDGRDALHSSSFTTRIGTVHGEYAQAVLSERSTRLAGDAGEDDEGIAASSVVGTCRFLATLSTVRFRRRYAKSSTKVARGTKTMTPMKTACQPSSGKSKTMSSPLIMDSTLSEIASWKLSFGFL